LYAQLTASLGRHVDVFQQFHHIQTLSFLERSTAEEKYEHIVLVLLEVIIMSSTPPVRLNIDIKLVVGMDDRKHGGADAWLKVSTCNDLAVKEVTQKAGKSKKKIECFHTCSPHNEYRRTSVAVGDELASQDTSHFADNVMPFK
jgi:hypothetical protein